MLNFEFGFTAVDLLGVVWNLHYPYLYTNLDYNVAPLTQDSFQVKSYQLVNLVIILQIILSTHQMTL